MQNQLEKMLELQDAMNTKVNKDWRGQNFAWYRAIWIECGELMDHYGWKWWKHQEPDVEQVKLELIDIWHFGLSIALINNMSPQDIAAEIKSVPAKTAGDFRELLEGFTQYTLTHKTFSIPLFMVLMQSIDMSFDDLYKGYIGKNVLNFFRQNNGYKAGTYIKIWDGREDNEHLVEAVAMLDPTAQDFSDQLYSALESRYPAS